jgi:serine/threonine protein kinase
MASEGSDGRVNTDWPHIPGFRIEEIVGRGGMGVVYRAEQEGLGRKVALKVIAPELSDDVGFRARFVREARLAASIDHPNVVPLFEAPANAHPLYLAMRFVDGEDLGALLAREGRLTPAAVGEIASQIGAALDAAHANGLVHRDVKPGNVLVTGETERPHAYLTDFGLTKDASSNSAQLTNTGQWVGTVDYIAPEQLDGRAVDARTDIYSLGCVVFQMLTGAVPFAGTNLQKMWGHGSGSPPSLRDARPELAGSFDAVVGRAMAKDPADRFPSAGDFGRACLAAANGESVTEPERSVAVGAAADGVAEAPTRVTGRSAAETTLEPVAPPWAKRPVPPAKAPPAATTVPVSASPRRRSRAIVPVAIVAVLGVGVAAGALVAARQTESPPSAPSAARSDTDSRSAADVERAAPPVDAEPPVDAATVATAPAESPATPVSYRSYTPSTAGYTASIPTGSGWSEPLESEPTPGRLFRTTIDGPDGTIVLIDYTPAEPAMFGYDEQSATPVEHPLFDSATEYVFTGGIVEECGASRCVDYILNSSDTAAGYAVLVGGSEDFARSRRIGRAVMRSLAYD